MKELERRFQKNLSLWAKTCPKEAVLLPYINPSDVVACKTDRKEINAKCKKFYLHSQKGAEVEASAWFQSLPLKDIPLVCVYGVGLGYYYDAIAAWLKKDKTRHLVFLEDNLSVIHRLFETERGTAILQNPQVQLLYFDEMDAESVIFEGLYWNFAMTKLLVSSLESYSKYRSEMLADLRHKIAYDAAMKNAQVDEYIRYGANYYINFYQNMLCLENSYLGNNFFGKFHKVPAIICGAGPSLAKNLEGVRSLLDKAIVFAGGSALNVLNSAGFQPHFGLGIDPNPAQYTRMSLNQGYEVPFFYRNRMYHDAFKMIHGPRLYITGAGGYDTASFFEERLGVTGELLDEGHNVVNFCVEVANAMGCDPIIFVGMDLAFTGMKEYAPGVIEDASVHQSEILQVEDEDERAILKQDIYEKPTYTLWKWVAESDWIGEFAKNHSSITMLNCTEGGLGFPGVKNITLKTASKKLLKRRYELKNRIHGETQNSTIKKVTTRKVSMLMKELSQSLSRAIDDFSILIEESKKMISRIKAGEKSPAESGMAALAETELLEELSYKHVIEVFNEVYARILSGDVHEIQVGRYSEAQKNTKRRELAIKKFKFLSDVAKANNVLIDYAFEQQKKEKKKTKFHVKLPSPPEAGLYELKRGKFIISDDEIGLSINQKFTPVIIPKNPKDGKTIASGHVLRVFLDDKWKINECYPEKDGVPDGQCLLYYPNGEIKEETYYKKGELHGPSRFWDNQGNLLAESWFVDGKQEGKSWWYYPSGKVYSLQRYLSNEWNGLQEFYYENGKVKTLMNYLRGNLSGVPVTLNPDGSKAR